MAMGNPRRVFRHWLAAIVALMLCASAMLAIPGAASPARATTPAQHSTRTDGMSNVLADYDAEIREPSPRADGIHHVDTPATIDALKRAHVNTYAYLVWHQPTDWSDLVNEFLPAAEQAQINVWVYLVPPSECCSQPYGTDYVAWAKAIAQLSQRYPNLTAWVIDDFVGNTSTFTPAYMEQMRQAAHAVNPTLPLYTIVYPGEYTSQFTQTYAPYIDGTIFPYIGAPGTNDLNDTSALSSELDVAISAMKPLGKRLYLMPYAAPFSGSPRPPTAATVSSMINTGLSYMHRGLIDGIVLYAMAKQFADETCQPVDIRHYLTLSVPWITPTSGGDHVDASQQVSVQPGASSYSITFTQQDSFPSVPGDIGYYDKQLLVNGNLVWHQDVAADPAETWTTETVDLTAALQGLSSATITFRLVNLKPVSNFGMLYDIAQVSGTGFTVSNGDFTSTTGWDFSSTSPNLYATYRDDTYVCDPQRQLHVYQAVQHGYGPDSLVYRALAATGISRGEKVAISATAQAALRLHQHGDDSAAAAVTAALARQAQVFGLPVLAQQAIEVAGELRS
jgi:hypothetical protein